MNKPVRVESVVRRHFCGYDDAKGEALVLHHLEVGLGIKFHDSGPSWGLDWSKRLVPNESTLALCDFTATILRDKRIDIIVTYDDGGVTPMLANLLAQRTARLCHYHIDTYAVEFGRTRGAQRPRRTIRYVGNPEEIVAKRRIFVLGDVLEQRSHALKLAREIVVFGKRHPELAPTLVGIGAPVIRDYGMKECVMRLLGFVPEIHYMVHARQWARRAVLRPVLPLGTIQEDAPRYGSYPGSR